MRAFFIGALFVYGASLAFGQQYACDLDMKIAVGELTAKDQAPKVLGEGMNSAISPDGSKVAFTLYNEEGARQIAVADVATGKVEPVSGIPGDNNYGPVWSPDGEVLYFNHFKDSDWTVARVNRGGGGFRIVLSRSVAFAVFPDGNALLCNDLEKFFVIPSEGDNSAAQKELPIDSAYGNISLPCRIDIAPDGGSALFEMSAEGDFDSDGFPAPSIWQIDLEDGALTRVTSKGVSASHPAWLPDGKEFLYTVYTPDGEASLQRVKLSPSSESQVVLENASAPTVAR